MQIQPAQPNVTNVAAYASSASSNGLEQDRVRADIPPVAEGQKNAPSQNQQFFATPAPVSASIPGDEKALKTITGRLEDENFDVRQAADEARVNLAGDRVDAF